MKVPRNKSSSILPSSVSCSIPSWYNTRPIHLCFRHHIVFKILLSSWTIRKISSFVFLSFQLISSILLQIHISKASSLLLSVSVNVHISAAIQVKLGLALGLRLKQKLTVKNLFFIIDIKPLCTQTVVKFCQWLEIRQVSSVVRSCVHDQFLSTWVVRMYTANNICLRFLGKYPATDIRPLLPECLLPNHICVHS